MQRISLKPIAREVSYKATEPHTYFDAFAYDPRDEKEKPFGNLYVVGQVKYGEENMAYVLGLVSSLAKREYYAENGSAVEDPKKALDGTLKKLNGVLEDFFQTQDLKLNIGLVAVAGENIYIAKLGRFKVLLVRHGEMIDILNNINLFQKEHVQERRFVNIISGKIYPGDKLLAFCPTRQTTIKEKVIKAALVKHGQEEFLTEFASYREKSPAFQCCGFHIEVKKFKEEDILIKSAYEKSKIILASSPEQDNSPRSIPITAPGSPSTESETSGPPQPESRPAEDDTTPRQAKIISAEMARIKRKNFFDKILGLFRKKGRLGAKGMIPAMVIILALGGGFYAAKKLIFSEDGGQSVILKAAEENIRLAEIRMTRNESADARNLLGLSLVSLTKIKETNRKVAEIRSKIATILDRLDLVSSRQPELFFDARTTEISKIVVLGDHTVMALDRERKVWKISDGIIGETGALPDLDAQYAFAGEKYFSVYNGLDRVEVLTLASGKLSGHQLSEPSPAQDAEVYENNLYILSGNAIYKYTDGAISGENKKRTWFSGLAEQNARALAIDGNVYVLTGQGTVIKYYRNKEEGRINFNIPTGENIEFFTDKEAGNFYVADYDDRKIRVFDKLNGSLLVTFKLTDLLVIKDFTVADKTAYIVSGDNKIWKINLGQ